MWNVIFQVSVANSLEAQGLVKIFEIALGRYFDRAGIVFTAHFNRSFHKLPAKLELAVWLPDNHPPDARMVWITDTLVQDPAIGYERFILITAKMQCL